MPSPRTLIAAALLAAAPALALAAGGHDHDHGHDHKPLHGGVVVEVKDVDYELVASASQIRLHLRDHGKPVDLAGTSARLTLLTGSEKQEVELKLAGDKLEASGSFKVGPGSKAVAVVTRGGKPATVRFTIK